MAHGASTKDLHFCLSFACLLAVSYVSPASLSSASTDLHHVILGLPLLHFPCGVHLSATLARLLFGNLKTWPNHLNLLLLTHAEIGSMLQLLSRSLFLIFSGLKILLLRRRHYVWNLYIYIILVYMLIYTYYMLYFC